MSPACHRWRPGILSALSASSRVVMSRRIDSMLYLTPLGSTRMQQANAAAATACRPQARLRTGFLENLRICLVDLCDNSSFLRNTDIWHTALVGKFFHCKLSHTYNNVCRTVKMCLHIHIFTHTQWSPTFSIWTNWCHLLSTILALSLLEMLPNRQSPGQLVRTTYFQWLTCHLHTIIVLFIRNQGSRILHAGDWNEFVSWHIGCHFRIYKHAVEQELAVLHQVLSEQYVALVLHMSPRFEWLESIIPELRSQLVWSRRAPDGKFVDIWLFGIAVDLAGIFDPPVADFNHRPVDYIIF